MTNSEVLEIARDVYSNTEDELVREVMERVIVRLMRREADYVS